MSFNDPTETVKQAPAFISASSSVTMNSEKSRSVKNSGHENSLVMESKIPVFSKPSLSQPSLSGSLPAKSARDSDMKKNLLDMLSKSGDRQGAPVQWKIQPLFSDPQKVDHTVQPDPWPKPHVRESKPSVEKMKSEKETEINHTDSIPSYSIPEFSRSFKATHSAEVDLDQSGKKKKTLTSHQRSSLNTGGTSLQEQGAMSQEESLVAPLLSTAGSISNTKSGAEIVPSGIRKPGSVQVQTQSLVYSSAGNFNSKSTVSSLSTIQYSSSKQAPIATMVSSIATKQSVSNDSSRKVLSKIDHEESGKSSDSLQSRDSERNTVPLSEEFEPKERVETRVSEIASDVVAETSSLPDLSPQQDNPEKNILVHK